MIEKLVIALAVTILGSLLIYVFKLKQLYLVVPRLFSNSLLSTNGRLVEIRIFNKGKNVETDVKVSFDPGISYEILAATDSTSSLNNSTVSIPRIPPGDDYSVLLHIEGGDFTNERISGVSSSTTKGKIFKNLSEIPPNAGNAILGILGLMLLAATPIAAVEGYLAWQESKAQSHTEEVSIALNNKWSAIEEYATSEFSKLYALGEFPIHYTEQHRVGKRVLVKFLLVNRAAANLDVRLEARWPFNDKEPEPWRNADYKYKTMPPVSNEIIEILLFWPKGKKEIAKFEFLISVGDEKYMSAKTEVKIDI